MFNRLFIFITIVTLLAVSNPAFAGTNGTGFKLTPEQIGEMNIIDRNAYFTAMKNAKERAETLQKEKVPESITNGITLLEEIDIDGLGTKLEAVADGIVKFCTRLGIGVEKFMSSKVGITIIIGIIYKMGMFGSIIDVSVLLFGLIFFSYIIIACNTNKIINLKDNKRNEKGEMVVISEREISIPRFNALFTYFTAKNEDESADINAIGIYRIFASILSLIMILVMIFNI